MQVRLTKETYVREDLVVDLEFPAYRCGMDCSDGGEWMWAERIAANGVCVRLKQKRTWGMGDYLYAVELTPYKRKTQGQLEIPADFAEGDGKQEFCELAEAIQELGITIPEAQCNSRRSEAKFCARRNWRWVR